MEICEYLFQLKFVMQCVEPHTDVTKKFCIVELQMWN